MKVVVTGASGQLGQALRCREPAGVQVSYLDRSQFDLCAPNLSLLDDATIVLNTAAYTAVDRAEAEPSLARDSNEIGPGLLAQACAERGAHLIHVSTDYVFGHAPAGRPIPADWHPTPDSVYGQTKLAGERAVLAVPGSTVVRTAWVYSGDCLAEHGDFVSTMLRLARGGQAPRVVADQIGSPTFAFDLADQLWRLAADPPGGLRHAVGAGQASWYELAREVFAAAGADPDQVTAITTAQWPTAARRPSWSVLASDYLLPEWRSGVARAVAGNL